MEDFSTPPTPETETGNVLPITVFGDPILRETGEVVDPEHPAIQALIQNMWRTMHNAHGVGLAAPQVAQKLQVFVVDAAPMQDLDPDHDVRGFQQTFINPVIEKEWGEEWAFEEGCLSIPGIREKVWRPEWVRVKWLDAQFREQAGEFNGVVARIIQHEFDHLNGVLFTDHLPRLRKQFLRPKLNKMARGKVEAEYPLKASR